MRSTEQLSVTLPKEMARMVRNKVSSGEYASESEVVRDGLRALQARDRALESWLRTEVVAAYDKARAKPASFLSAAEVRARLAAHHKRAVKKRSWSSDTRLMQRGSWRNCTIILPRPLGQTEPVPLSARYRLLRASRQLSIPGNQARWSTSRP